MRRYDTYRVTQFLDWTIYLDHPQHPFSTWRCRHEDAKPRARCVQYRSVPHLRTPQRATYRRRQWSRQQSAGKNIADSPQVYVDASRDISEREKEITVHIAAALCSVYSGSNRTSTRADRASHLLPRTEMFMQMSKNPASASSKKMCLG